MISARCSQGDAATAGGAPPPSVEDLLAGVPGVEDALPDSVVSVPAAAANGGRSPTAARGAAVGTTGRQSGTDFWGLDRINQYGLPLDGDTSTADCYPSRGAGVTVYVVDSGCAAGHPQFEGRATTEAGPGSRYPSGVDDNAHGSHVAGTVGGRDTGVATRVTIRCVKVLNARGYGSSTDIAAAFDAVAGAKAADPAARLVLSASLGGAAPPGGRSVTGTAARRAAEAGVVTVVAAGNDGGDACAFTPAQEPSLITVANVDRTDRLSRDSNRGSCVDVAAPGTNILSVDGTSRRGGFRLYSGTSMAAPHVAGVAALIMADAPDGARLTTADVLARMTAGAPRVGGYPMAYAGGGACGGRPRRPAGPAPTAVPDPTRAPRSPAAPGPCTRRWRRECRQTGGGAEQCRWVLVCAETGQPPRRV